MSPVQLFLTLWREAASWKASQRRGIPATKPSWTAEINAALANDSGEIVSERLLNVRAVNCTEKTAEYRAITLAILRGIDSSFAEAHPRNGRGRGLKKWLREAQEHRIDYGCYFSDESSYVIACGPLLRKNRGEHASNADTLAERFSFLAVTPRFIPQDETPVEIEIRVISDDAGAGVPPGVVIPGEELVCAIPVALKRDEISAKAKQRQDTTFVQFSHADGKSSGEIFVEAALHARNGLNHAVDIAMGPEFLVDHHQQSSAATLLKKSSPLPSRMFILGSGVTADLSDIGQPWNEAIVVNGSGVELWRQRKVWPASIDRQRAIDYGVEGLPADAEQLFEDISSGESIQIVDIDGIGRCVILICQDFVAKPLCNILLRKYQPDWVFVPILDRGMAEGNWFHQEAIHHSSYTRSRFVAVTSIGLPRKGGDSPLPCVMAVCSLQGEGHIPSGAFICKSPLESHPSYALVRFGTENWERLSVGSRKVK